MEEIENNTDIIQNDNETKNKISKKKMSNYINKVLTTDSIDYTKLDDNDLTELYNKTKNMKEFIIKISKKALKGKGEKILKQEVKKISEKFFNWLEQNNEEIDS
jgi:hypothetical protein